MRTFSEGDAYAHIPLPWGGLKTLDAWVSCFLNPLSLVIEDSRAFSAILHPRRQVRDQALMAILQVTHALGALGRMVLPTREVESMVAPAGDDEEHESVNEKAKRP